MCECGIHLASRELLRATVWDGEGVGGDMQWVLWCIAALLRVRVHLAYCVGGHMQVVTFTMT